MTTAIIGVGNIGSAVAQHLVDGAEAVALPAIQRAVQVSWRRDSASPRAPRRSRTRSHKQTRSCSPYGSIRSRS